MRNRRIRLAVAFLCSGFFLGAMGCAGLAGPKHAGRTAAEREKLIKVTGDAAQSNRRNFFDFWNEQIVREDVAAGTVFMGDSITELWDLQVYFQPGKGLIENRGISGDLASRMAARFEADVIQLRPRNVVILAGTNDVSKLIREGKSDEEIIADVTASNESMMKAAQAAGLNTMVCSILPTNSDYGRHAERTYLRAKINEKLKEACKAHGCVYVDYAAQMRDANGDLRKELARDGLHPHYAGYEIMARMLKEAAKAKGWRL